MSDEQPEAETPAAEAAPTPKKKGARKGKGKKAKPETPDLLTQAEEAASADAAATATPADEPAPPPAEEAPAKVEAEASESNGADKPVEPVNEEEAAALAAQAAPLPGEEVVEAPVDMESLARTVEALLFAAEEPIAPREIARASGSDSATIRKVLKEIRERYEQLKQPWDIAEVANGFRMVSRPEYYPAIQRLKTQTAQRKLTQAALETLALIAYRQPIGRSEVESVRGVGAGPVLRMLLEKKLIKISGRGTGVGQPLLYGTTDYFLEHFGLKSTQDLPKPGEFKNT